VDGFATYWHKESPAIVDLYENGRHRYNRVVDRSLTGGEGRVKWREIAPLKPLRSEGFRVQKEDLLADYHHGLACALDWLSGDEGEQIPTFSTVRIRVGDIEGISEIASVVFSVYICPESPLP
jgi:hypothetical protein